MKRMSYLIPFVRFVTMVVSFCGTNFCGVDG